MSRSCARAAETDQRRPRVGPLMMQKSGPTGSSSRAVSHGSSCSRAQSSMPTSRRRPPLPRRTSTAPRRESRSLSARGERLADPQPGARQHDDQATQALSVGALTGGAHDGDDLFDAGRVCRIAHPVVARGPPAQTDAPSRPIAQPLSLETSGRCRRRFVAAGTKAAALRSTDSNPVIRLCSARHRGSSPCWWWGYTTVRILLWGCLSGRGGVGPARGHHRGDSRRCASMSVAEVAVQAS